MSALARAGAAMMSAQEQLKVKQAPPSLIGKSAEPQLPHASRIFASARTGVGIRRASPSIGEDPKIHPRTELPIETHDQHYRMHKALTKSSILFQTRYSKIAPSENLFEVCLLAGEDVEACSIALAKLRGEESAQALDLIYQAMLPADRKVRRKDFRVEHAQVAFQDTGVDLLPKTAQLLKAHKMMALCYEYIKNQGIERVLPSDQERHVRRLKADYYDSLTGLTEANRDAGRLVQMRLLDACYVMRGGSGKWTFSSTIGAFDSVTIDAAFRLGAYGFKLLRTQREEDALAAFIRKLSPAPGDESEEDGGVTARTPTSVECRLLLAGLRRDFPDVYTVLATSFSSAVGSSSVLASERYIAKMDSSKDVAMLTHCATLIRDFNAGLPILKL